MKREFLDALRPAFVLILLFTLLTGVLYPVTIWITCHDYFAYESEGSLIEANGHVFGSQQIGQSFTGARYLWGRPSATRPSADNAAASSGSNLGPLNPALATAVAGRIAALRQADSTLTGPIPVDLVTASASGLDPEISPAAAYAQIGRIARARGIPPEAVRAAIARHLAEPTFGVLGEARVNVLYVNLDLDGALHAPAKRS